MIRPSRRALMGGIVLMAAPIAPASAVVISASPDAALIRECNAYIAALGAYNSDLSRVEDEDNPLWHALSDIEGRLERMEATTLAGLAAEARIAIEVGEQPSGRFCHSAAGNWMERVARGVLRLVGDAS